MKDYLGYIIARFFSFIFCLLPLRTGLFIGRRLGTLAFWLNKKRRMLAYVNLKAAFSAEKGPAELRKLTEGVYQNLGCLLVEVLRFPKVDNAYIKKYISFEGLESLKVARAKGNGTIILTGHFGNWELLSLTGGVLNYPISVLAREQKHTRLNDLLNSYRQMAGCKVIKKGLSTRNLIKALKSNEIVGILTDQDAGKLGTFVDFFGRPTSTHSGAFVFAEKTGSTILPAFIVRENGPYHKIDVLNPIDFTKTGDSKKDVESGVQEFSRILESYVRKYPSQWLWVHKRWKSTPQRNIVILNDTKAGHLNQGIAVAQIIQKYRIDKGHAPEHTKYEVVDVKYRKGSGRGMLTIAGNFSSSHCQGCMACMRMSLTKASYDKLMAVHADIVISCGASLAPVNVLMAKENNAKSVIIMRPSLIGLKKFNLAIIPRHDRPKRAKNVLVTIGAPNRITDELIQGEAKRIAAQFGLPQAKARIGLLIGGSNPDYEMGMSRIKEVIAGVKAVSQELKADIIVTTSRRTPKAVEEALKAELSGFPRCRLLVIANEKNIEGVVPAILGLCDVVLVSGESISMISEAATSGKHVIVFPLKKKAHNKTRHDELVSELKDLGYIHVADAGEAGSTAKRLLGAEERPKRLNDYDRIYNAIGGLL